MEAPTLARGVQPLCSLPCSIAVKWAPSLPDADDLTGHDNIMQLLWLIQHDAAWQQNTAIIAEAPKTFQPPSWDGASSACDYMEQILGCMQSSYSAAARVTLELLTRRADLYDQEG